jgi:hypothetical protein
MTNKIKDIKLRKYLSPNDSRNLVKEFILSLQLRGHTAEFAFYVQKVPFRQSFALWRTGELRFFKKPGYLSYATNRNDTRIWA